MRKGLRSSYRRIESKVEDRWKSSLFACLDYSEMLLSRPAYARACGPLRFCLRHDDSGCCVSYLED